AVDLAKHLFGPGWGRQAFQLMLDTVKLANRGGRMKQPLFGRFGGKINGQENTHRLSKISANGILQDSSPLRPQSLRRVPQERRLDRSYRSGSVLGDAHQRGQLTVLNHRKGVDPPRPPWIGADGGSGSIFMHPGGLALDLLAQFVFGVSTGCAEPCR